MTRVGFCYLRLQDRGLLQDCIGFAVLIDDPAAHSSPELVALERWNSDREELVQSQIAALEAKDTRDHSKDRSTTARAHQKREQREARRAAAAMNKTDADTDLVVAEDPIQAPRPPQTVPAYTIVVPGTSASFSWYTPTPHTYSTIQAAKDAGIWSYPSDLVERAKCAVFRDLWDKGYYMGGGLKFGGDFLVYPGVPSSKVSLQKIHTFQATHCGITLTSPQQLSNLRKRRSCPWRSWLMGGLVLSQRKPICSAHGMRLRGK